MWNMSNVKCNIVKLKTKLIEFCKDIYLKMLQEYSKLDLYSSIKTKCKREMYLYKITNMNHRQAISQLRLSSHNLPIETGRYKNVERKNRLCKMCNYKIGSEEHCLMECFHPKLTGIRNTYLHEIFRINNNLKQLPRNLLFKYIILFTDINIISQSAAYIYTILQIYKQLNTCK